MNGEALTYMCHGCQMYRHKGRTMVRTGGIDFGPRVEEVAREGKYAFWISHGHTGWLCVGEREYVPAQYIVAEWLDERTACTLYREVPGRRWRDARRRFSRYTNEGPPS